MSQSSKDFSLSELPAISLLSSCQRIGEREVVWGKDGGDGRVGFFFKLQFSGAEKVRFQHSLHLLLMFKDKRHS